MKIVFTPDWFTGSDILIEFFSFLVLAAFFILSYRSYKASKNKNSLYLGWGFLLIAVAELATIFTKAVLFYDTSFTQTIGQMVVTYSVVHSVDILYYAGFFFHRLFTLLGMYMIYRIPLEKNNASDAILAVFFIIIASLFSSAFYYIFHLTALILILFIIRNYCKIYKKNKSQNTKLLIVAFSMLAASQMIFVLSTLKVCYVFAQIVQLVSYIILLFLIILILRASSKKKKAK